MKQGIAVAPEPLTGVEIKEGSSDEISHKDLNNHPQARKHSLQQHENHYDQQNSYGGFNQEMPHHFTFSQRKSLTIIANMEILEPELTKYQSTQYCWKITSIVFIFLSVLGLINFIFLKYAEGVLSVVGIISNSFLLKSTSDACKAILLKQYKLLDSAYIWMRYTLYVCVIEILIVKASLIYYIIMLSQEQEQKQIDGVVGSAITWVIYYIFFFYFVNLNRRTQKIQNQLKQCGLLETNHAIVSTH